MVASLSDTKLFELLTTLTKVIKEDVTGNFSIRGRQHPTAASAIIIRVLPQDIGDIYDATWDSIINELDYPYTIPPVDIYVIGFNEPFDVSTVAKGPSSELVPMD
jgi:hypothetical protein